MHRFLAVDPGERYVGIADFQGDQVIRADTLTPEQAVDWIWDLIERGDIEGVVIEQWRNYDATITWSECETVEVIGAVRHKCRRHGKNLVKQPALIKRPGRARMRAHGHQMPNLDHIPTRLRVHVQDAIIHGYWYRLDRAAKGIDMSPPGWDTN